MRVCRPLGRVGRVGRVGYIERDLEEDRPPQEIPSHLQDIAIAVIGLVALAHVGLDDFIN